MILNDSDSNWWTGGIDFNAPGYGGADCRDHVTTRHRIVETTLGASLSLLSLVVGVKLLKSKTKSEGSEVRYGCNWNQATGLVLKQ